MGIETPSGIVVPGGTRVPAGTAIPSGSTLPAGAAAPDTPLTLITSVPISLWIDANIGTTENAGLLSDWADQGPSHHDGLQHADPNKPSIAADAGIGGLKAVSFTKAGSTFFDFTFARTASGTTPAWMWIVLKQTAWVNGDQLISDQTDLCFTLRQQTATPDLCMRAATNQNFQTGFATNTWGQLQLGFTASTSSFTQLGANAPVTGGNEGGGATAGTGVRLGANAALTVFGNMKLAALVLTLGMPTLAERNAMVGYGTGRFGV